MSTKKKTVHILKIDVPEGSLPSIVPGRGKKSRTYHLVPRIVRAAWASTVHRKPLWIPQNFGILHTSVSAWRTDCTWREFPSSPELFLLITICNNKNWLLESLQREKKTKPKQQKDGGFLTWTKPPSRKFFFQKSAVWRRSKNVKQIMTCWSLRPN